MIAPARPDGTARVRAAFAAADAAGRAAIIPYVTAGDPSPADDALVLHALAAGGADVIELGVAFTEPSADGPTIQRAMARALAAGASLPSALAAVRRFRDEGGTTPIVLFGYYNPIFTYGVTRFAGAAALAGVDATLIVDLPIDAFDEIQAPWRAHGLGVVPLVAPTSTDDRLARLREVEAAFVYYVSVAGVTGSQPVGLPARARLAAIRALAGAPVAVGFGVRTHADVAQVAAVADGVVIGSALIEHMHAATTAGPTAAPAAATAMLRQLALGLTRAG